MTPWRFAGLALLCLQLACATPDAPLRAEQPIVLLGETHDNARHHALQHELFEALLQTGARPALLMEQFDRERQPDIDRAIAAGADAQGVIGAASDAAGARWQWPFYEPLIALALRHRLPIVAANVSRADTRRIIADGLAAHGFDAQVPADIEAVQAAQIERSHCGLIDAATARRMTAAQIARDQFMARLVQQHAARGVVLIAGHGHVRRDVGVPRWLAASERSRTEAIGLVEQGSERSAGSFDRVVVTPPQPRADPCASMRRSSRERRGSLSGG